MRKVRLGVIGVGNMGTGHINNILSGQCPEIEVTAMADHRESRRQGAAEHRHEMDIQLPSDAFRPAE